MTRDFDEELALLEERVKEARFLLRDCQYGIRELKRRLDRERRALGPMRPDSDP